MGVLWTKTAFDRKAKSKKPILDDDGEPVVWNPKKLDKVEVTPGEVSCLYVFYIYARHV